ncbi:MAG: hypothetical protein ACLSAP_00360 [Oscillospiraceae bacterium]
MKTHFLLCVVVINSESPDVAYAANEKIHKREGLERAGRKRVLLQTAIKPKKAMRMQREKGSLRLHGFFIGL